MRTPTIISLRPAEDGASVGVEAERNLDTRGTFNLPIWTCAKFVPPKKLKDRVYLRKNLSLAHQPTRVLSITGEVNSRDEFLISSEFHPSSLWLIEQGQGSSPRDEITHHHVTNGNQLRLDEG